MTDQKNTLKHYLQVGRECLLWKLDGLNVNAETHRHVRHTEIARELIDGGRGWAPSSPNLPSFDSESWSAFLTKVEQAALRYIESC